MSTVESTKSLEDQDESVRIAVRALDDMRNRPLRSHSPSSSYPSTSFQPTPALSVASSSSSPSVESLPLPAEDINSPDFVSRVSTFPIVNTALKAYEQSKANSSFVKFGAEMMESSVKSISQRLPVNQLDEFACRQLDRFGRYKRRSSSSHQDCMELDSPSRNASVERRSSTSRSPIRGREKDTWSNGLQMRMRDVSMGPSDRASDRQMSESRSRPGTPTQSSQPISPRSDQWQEERARGREAREAGGQEVVPRSRWQAVLLEAGGLGAAISDDSMKRLKYCLQWLQFATAHIDGQILAIRDFIASLQPTGSGLSDALVSSAHMKTLNDIKKDVVHTIREVVDVVSKYAGGALPEPAQTRVRGFILTLPQRWATATKRQRHDQPHSTSTSVDSSPVVSASALPPIRPPRDRGIKPYSREPSRSSSPVNSAPSSPRTSRVHSRQGTNNHSHGYGGFGGSSPTAGSATVAAHRILTLATESLDMMRGVTGVVKDSLDRAEAWVERLRVVGIQRQGQSEPESPVDQRPRPLSPPPQNQSPFWVPSASSSGSAPPPLPLSDSYSPFSFPVPVDAPSPMGATASSMGALSLQQSASASTSEHATPRVAVKKLDEDRGWSSDRFRREDDLRRDRPRSSRRESGRQMDVDS